MGGGLTLIALFIWLLALVPEAPCYQCQKYLSWAPRSPRSVFMAMFNHAHCHSWTTRHPITLRPTGKSTIELPRGIPFAFWCGACFARSSLNASLTISLHPEGPMVSEPLKSSRGEYQHSVSDSTTCILTYGLAGPLEGRGRIRCRLQWGIRQEDEFLSFSVRGASVIEEGRAVEVETTDSRGATLTCPSSDLRDKRNIVRVWYYSDGAPAPAPPRVANPTLDANITFWPKLAAEEEVACAIYDLTKGTPVWRRTFRVRAARPQHVGAGQSEAAPSQAQSGFFSVNRSILIGSLVAIGVLIAVALSCLSLGFCQRGARRPPLELTKQNLLPLPLGPRNTTATGPEVVHR